MRAALSCRPVRHPSLRRAVTACTAQDSPQRFAVVGGGFAGVAVAWHLLAAARPGRPVQLDLFDAFGLGAGGSGAAAGLLHPYTPRGKMLWRGMEAFEDALHLVAAAEAAAGPNREQITWRHGLLRPCTTPKQASDLEKFVPSHGAAVQAATQAQCVDAAGMEALLPGLAASSCVPGVAGLLVRRGLVLHPHRYLRALWDACQQTAAQRGDHSAACLRIQPVSSLLDLHPEPRDPAVEYDAVIVAAGAAMDCIRETAGLLKVELCQGQTLHMRPPGGGDQHGTSRYPHNAPSLLGSTYIAAHGSDALVVGATKQYGVSPATAYAQCSTSTLPASDAQAVAAAQALLPPATKLWSPLAAWEVEAVRSGVRALPGRTPQGSLPYAGRIPSSSSWWLIGGLGARGLVYHAWLGRLVAAAVLAEDQNCLPEELRRWQAGQGTVP